MRCSTLLTILTVVLLYLVMGALVFRTLEIPKEEKAYKKLIDAQNTFLENHNCVTTNHLKDFIQDVVNAIEAGVDTNSYFPNFTSRWDLSSAFFFCGTIITTIGFGHLSPKSEGGQLFCIFYALVGIPMFGILLAGVGDHLGTMLRRAVGKIETLFLQRRVSPTSVRILSAVFSILIGCLIFIAVPTLVFQEVENWSLLEAGYFVVITLTTVGFGDYVTDDRRDGVPMYKPLVWLWIVFGLAYFASILTMIGNWLRVLSKKTRAEMEELRAHATDWTQNIQNMSMDFRIPVPLDLNDPFQLQRRRKRKRHRKACHHHHRVVLDGSARRVSTEVERIRENGHLVVGWPEAGFEARPVTRLDVILDVRRGSRLSSRGSSRPISKSDLRMVSGPEARPEVKAASEAASESETPSESWSESESNSHISGESCSSLDGAECKHESERDVSVATTPPRPTLLDFFGENLAYIDESSDTLNDWAKQAGAGVNHPRKHKKKSPGRRLPYSIHGGLERVQSGDLQPPSYPPTPPPPLTPP
ncbi:potassium channel subfamily K member 4 [Chanos chanos]|uniref:Potassium channel subfamily K member 4 n=1 Tax=Chanos chanos TaxID=29144 RepID=A0A6J2UMN9_CHACN|nr:potassium channel subfamily K member 4-like [Chanos chanos]